MDQHQYSNTPLSIDSANEQLGDVLLEDVQELLQLRVAGEERVVSDQLGCNLQPD
jgi:hypothetical protein